MVVSPIKTQGKKTKIIPNIIEIVPELKDILYIEPFLGSGEVLFNINPQFALVSDNNIHIINFYKSLQNKTITPQIVREFLEINGAKLQEQGCNFYYEMRKKFNETQSPLYFLFLNRSCFNGVMRFNNKGEFNVPFCNKDNRFAKALITKIVNQVSLIQDIILQHGDKWKFVCCDWTQIEKYNDFDCKKSLYYFDPPYVERHSTYFDAWTEDKNKMLFEHIISLKEKFILSNWLSNNYRTNTHIDTYFRDDKFNILPIEHFYHVGGKELNRNAILECLITNF
ncbi:DNA adenine methylase [Pumilibacter muris]|uniref:DNA adenine methylase n=1 Tax=Pumilibacter muris TaxID=2941510 RepID=UPI00203DF8E5|nr:Dam family site-specific DNA-(adenine-N6)-methyltransferase [Pumilibacter muris]